MPGPEDYSYEHEDTAPSAFEPTTPEVSQADSNPAYYPAEAKSEDLRTDDEKQALKEAEESAADKGETDVVNGEGDKVMSAEEAKDPEPVVAAKSVPKSKSTKD